MSVTVKNRDREPPSFGNINFMGKCNFNCFFCLGKDIDEKTCGINQLNTHFSEWKDFYTYLDKCNRNNINRLYLTGLNADPMQYRFLGEIVDFLHGAGFKVGIRTNGYLALKKINVLNRFDSVSFSIHSLWEKTNKLITGIEEVPRWKEIFERCNTHKRVSIVVNRYNVLELDDLINFLDYRLPKYIQLRKVATDTRYEQLKLDMDAYDLYYDYVKRRNFPMKKLDETFYGAEIYGLGNYNYPKVIFWETIKTSINSMNYFTDGTITDNYFVIEGYLNNKNSS